MSWLRRCWNAFRNARVRGDIERELKFHVAERAKELRADGLSEEEAQRQARLRFGNMGVHVEDSRDVKVATRLEALGRNIRYSVRALRRAPGFAVTVVMTLALGIGANTAVFSAIDAVLLRPLSFPAADRLMLVTQTQERSSETNVAPIRLEDWNRLNSTFEAITGYLSEDVSDTSGDLPKRVRRSGVAPRFFQVWGTPPALGRSFTQADHQQGAPFVVIISDRYWHNRFGRDPNVLGKQVRIGPTPFSIVGVMPGSFRFPEQDVDLWVPRSIPQVRIAVWYRGIGRLKPGISIEQARADMQVVQRQLAEEYPDTDRAIGVQISPLQETLVSGAGSSLWLLFAAVSLLLLIACLNICSLLLSRAVHRQREASIRMSLGASRRTIAEQTLTEVGILAFTGTIAGLLIAAAAPAAFRLLAPGFPRLDEIHVDLRILLYALFSLGAVTVLCGFWPAIRGTSGSLAGVLAEGARTNVGSRHRLQWILVGVQVALSVLLLVGAGLLLRSFEELSRAERGFQPDRVLAFRISGTWSESGDRARLQQFTDRVLDGLRELPEVDASAVTITAPGVPNTFQEEFQVAERRTDTTDRLLAGTAVVSPSYFETMGMSILEGDLCRHVPLDARWREMMVNRTFANRYFQGSPVLGFNLVRPDASFSVPPGRIVGIIADTRERGIDRNPEPTVYFCENPVQPFRVFLIRTRGEPMAIAQAVRLKMKEIDPLRSVYDIAPLEAWIGDAFSQNRLRTVLLTGFALTAFSLACVGLYGTLAYVVSLRRREVGLRLALGAMPQDIVRHYLWKGLRIVTMSCGIGLVLSLVFSRFLSGVLYGISPQDPATLVAVVALVFLVSTVAALLPAVRAALVDPMRVLREE